MTNLNIGGFSLLHALLVIGLTAQLTNCFLASKGSYVPAPGVSDPGPGDGAVDPVDPPPEIDDLNAAAKYEMDARREQHGTRPLTYKPELQEISDRAAKFYAQDKVAIGLKPNQTSSGFDCQNVTRFSDLPDNIGVQFAIVGTTNTAKIAMGNSVDRWYQRQKADLAHNIPAYPFTNVKFDGNLTMYSPFTQLIWDSTTAYACSMTSVSNPGNKIRMIACCFEPAGNVVIDGSTALYEKNVPRKV